MQYLCHAQPHYKKNGLWHFCRAIKILVQYLCHAQPCYKKIWLVALLQSHQDTYAVSLLCTYFSGFSVNPGHKCLASWHFYRAIKILAQYLCYHMFLRDLCQPLLLFSIPELNLQTHLTPCIPTSGVGGTGGSPSIGPYLIDSREVFGRTPKLYLGADFVSSNIIQFHPRYLGSHRGQSTNLALTLLPQQEAMLLPKYHDYQGTKSHFHRSLHAKKNTSRKNVAQLITVLVQEGISAITHWTGLSSHQETTDQTPPFSTEP